MEKDVEDFKNDMLKNINVLEKDRNHTRNLVQCINEMEILKQEFSDLLSSESESEIDYESLDELDYYCQKRHSGLKSEKKCNLGSQCACHES